ncbi:hypothetical protein CBL_10977 [Carabus blaptoides fortunei]
MPCVRRIPGASLCLRPNGWNRARRLSLDSWSAGTPAPPPFQRSQRPSVTTLDGVTCRLTCPESKASNIYTDRRTDRRAQTAVPQWKIIIYQCGHTRFESFVRRRQATDTWDNFTQRPRVLESNYKIGNKLTQQQEELLPKRQMYVSLTCSSSKETCTQKGQQMQSCLSLAGEKNDICADEEQRWN